MSLEHGQWPVVELDRRRPSVHLGQMAALEMKPSDISCGTRLDRSQRARASNPSRLPESQGCWPTVVALMCQSEASTSRAHLGGARLPPREARVRARGASQSNRQ